MRRRQLSSNWTFPGKFLVSACFALMAALTLVFAIFFFRKNGAHSLPAMPVLAFFVVITGTIARRMMSWKRVCMDTRSLYVSNYFKEIDLPFSQIAEVTEQRWLGRTVIIRLRQVTAFGDTICFGPRAGLFRPWSRHPVVDELRRIAGGSVVSAQDLEQSIARDRRMMWLGVTVAVLFAGGLLAFIQTVMKGSDAYIMGLAAVRQDAAVTQALGAPIEPGFWINGEINKSPGSGSAALQFSLHGPLGRGEANVEASEERGVWHLRHVWVVQPEQKQAIEVIPEATSHP